MTDDKPIDRELEQMGRKDFLRTMVGMSAAVGLGSMALADRAEADDQPEGRYLFIITHGADAPDRAVLALVLAKAAAAKKMGQVDIWLTMGGGDLAHKTKAGRVRSQTFYERGSAADLMTELQKLGARFWICPPCASNCGALDASRVEYVQNAGGAWLMQAAQGAWTTCF